jgi:hypothetical protein
MSRTISLQRRMVTSPGYYQVRAGLPYQCGAYTNTCGLQKSE